MKKILDVSTDVSVEAGLVGLTEVFWRCECGFQNLDLYELTAIPVCGGCFEEVFWEEILPEETA